MVPTLILASNSPRRRRLLNFTGWTFTVRPVDVDERPLPGEPPDEYVLRLAESKARAAWQYVLPGQAVLAADTTVADGLNILGKPMDGEEARRMLQNLRGRMHIVYTAVAVLKSVLPGSADSGTMQGSIASIDHPSEPPRIVKDVCATRVWMREYTDGEIEDYIASGDPFDKAGAYAIQNPVFQPVERIAGCYCCVVGLPVCAAVRALARLGLVPPENVTSGCAAHLEMDTPCPVYQALLRQESGKEPDLRDKK
jgi:MAF protein